MADSRVKVDRKEIKKRARGVLKRHYWFFMVLCLAAAFLGVEFTSSLNFLQLRSSKEVSQEEMPTGIVGKQPSIIDVVGEAIGGNPDASSEISNQLKEQAAQDTKEGKGSRILGRSRGVLAGIVNEVASGAILATIINAVLSMAGSSEIAFVLLIAGSLLLALVVWFFFFNMYKVVYRRIFLEGRLYDELSVQRMAFLVRVKKWTKVSRTMFLMSLFQFLWILTIVGGVIKRYSYFMVPYIVAENPDIAPLKAIRMSRKMMNGHKWECFVLELSYLGWNILGNLTLGLSGIFYSNPYQIAAYCEYYTEIRAAYLKQPDAYAELLNDRYLFEKASDVELKSAYGDTIAELKEQSAEKEGKKGFAGFIANVFGVTFSYDKTERLYQENEERKIKIKTYGDAARGNAYPGRLSPIPEHLKKKRVETLHYLRHYSVWSLILLFFTFSLIGWIWEVSLHLISDGVFVNRGVMHGPWLPIYGTGGVLILVVLNKFRSRPALEFVTTVVLCGCVEYFTSLFLELAHDGQKWWDYSGYFLNLNGRICAEGLLVFGLGGMAIVYLLAPMLDNFIRKMPMKVIVPICVVLLGAFGVDHAYSSKHPNTGKGITDYTGADMEEYKA